MNEVDRELVREVTRLHEGLSMLSYYDFLALRPGCDYVTVREAFYARAQRFHPDRFVAMKGDAIRQAAYEVYKRMTESFNVLMDPQLRLAYDAVRLQGKSRLSDVARAKRRLGADERQVANLFARIYMRSARAKLERGDIEAAWIDVQLGLSLEEALPLRGLLRAIRSHPKARSLGLANEDGGGEP
jgi:DnaJ-class molecular chaperone